MNRTRYATFETGRFTPGVAILVGLVVAIAFALGWMIAGRDDALPSPTPSTVCHACFWEYQDPAFRRELIGFYEAFRPEDPLVAADVGQLLGRVLGDPARVCGAFRAFLELRESETEPSRRLFVDEVLAFTAEGCGEWPGPYFGAAARSARDAGDGWKAGVYDAVARGAFRPRFDVAEAVPLARAPDGTTGYVLGESRVEVRDGDRVGVQVERTVRDWLSYQMAFDPSSATADAAALLDYHEGARLGDLARIADLEIVPLPGALAARKDGLWYAPDADGVFRFEVLPDKVQYPTTRSHGDLALLVDTHGISSLVERAARREVDVVVGCGDSAGKVRAANDLATRGLDVYFPCDRFVGDLIGYDAPGTILGSAPIRAEGDVAIIGDRPLAFSTDEVVVVQDAPPGSGALQYYDAAARYFERLGSMLDLRVTTVTIDGAGQSDRVVRRARETAARAIALRVWTEEDYGPVRDWLAESPEHRAVLFHSAPYPAGYRLFGEFPDQTTFGDPRPRFTVD